MLNLASETPPGWAQAIVGDDAALRTLLIDHAHCEKKAASTALSLMFKYPQHRPLLVPLSRLAREELAHFEEVLGHLDRRGATFERMHPCAYAGQLLKITRDHEPAHLLDTLLCAALIEARSCERMQRIAEALESAADPDPALARLYRGLLASEARHHATYVDLARACELAPEAELRDRLQEIAAHEAQVLARLPMTPVRMHSGHGPPPGS